VLNVDPDSIAAYHATSLPAMLNDALISPPELAPRVVIFNRILPHFVGAGEPVTHALHQRARQFFVNEYIYASNYAGLWGG
jgi:hypothetical protein